MTRSRRVTLLTLLGMTLGSVTGAAAARPTAAGEARRDGCNQNCYEKGQLPTGESQGFACSWNIHRIGCDAYETNTSYVCVHYQC
jgi:hypothetical protein